MKPAKFKCPEKIQVKYSKGKGRGIFAAKTIRKGEMIEAAPALLVPKKSRKPLEASFLKHYMFQTNEGHDYVLGMGYVAIANHSDSPNAEFDVTKDMVIVRAITGIKVGQEITLDYGWDDSDWSEIGGLAER
jgi:SET domain-containing protein